MSRPTDEPRGNHTRDPIDTPDSLGRNEVAVWCVEDGPQITDARLARYAGLLDDDERRRHDRYRADRARRQFLIGRALVRSTLSRYRPQVPPEQWSFVSNEYGRPEIAPGLIDDALRFNLSHTDGFAACAVTCDRDVGVDVEFVGRRTGGVHLARRFFSSAEVADLLGLPEERQRDAFFDYWTLKEAYIKARGMGLAIPLGHFSFHLRQGPSPRISFDARLNDSPAEWQFAQFSPTPEHRMALAVRCGAAERVSVGTFSCVPLGED